MSIVKTTERSFLRPVAGYRMAGDKRNEDVR